MPEALKSPNLFLEKTVFWIGRVISVGKMQMHCQLMPDCSMSQIGSKYILKFPSRFKYIVTLIVGQNRWQKLSSKLKVLEHTSHPNPSIKFVNRL